MDGRNTVKISFQYFQQFSVGFESCGSSVLIFVSIPVIFFLIECFLDHSV